MGQSTVEEQSGNALSVIDTQIMGKSVETLIAHLNTKKDKNEKNITITCFNLGIIKC